MEKKKQGKLCFPAGSGEWTVGRYRRVEEAEGAVEKVLLLSWRVLKYIQSIVRALEVILYFRIDFLICRIRYGIG